MEFPIEIQMLINAYAKPITRPDWKRGSFLNMFYRSSHGQCGRLDMDEFKLYLERCSELDNEYDDIKHIAWTHEKRSLTNYEIIVYRIRNHPDYESDEDLGYDFYDI